MSASRTVPKRHGIVEHMSLARATCWSSRHRGTDSARPGTRLRRHLSP